MTWPVKPEEYGSYMWLRREVGGYLGYGYDQSVWKHEEQGLVDSVVQSGVMQFYFPPPLPSETPQPPHRWTFLSPVASITTANGVQAYDLPDDFSGILDEFTHQTGAATKKIPLVSEAQLRQLRATADKSGSPLYAAVRPKPSDGGAAQKSEVLFYPTPDEALTLEYRYVAAPLPLSEESPWPLGARQHAETILQSCLAVAEQRQGKADGPASARFLQRLAAAVQQDAQSFAATEDGVWPVEEEADGLIANKAYLKRLLGRQMGFGPHKGAWSHRQSQEVDLALQTGLRKFYSPPVLPRERNSHEWSFLRPLGTLSLVGDDYDYDLPQDFAMMAEPTLTFEQGSAVLYPPVPIVGEHQIRQRLQRTEASARPEVAAVRVKRPDEGEGTRYELLVWPIPDQEYTLNYRYVINPESLPDDTALPLGGQPHMQTVIEACLAAAEEMSGRPGLHSDLFLQRIAASVAHDRKASAPHTLGINIDRSDYPGHRDYWHHSHHDHDANLITYNGVQH